VFVQVTEKDFLEAVNKVIKAYSKFSATPKYVLVKWENVKNCKQIVTMYNAVMKVISCISQEIGTVKLE